MVKIELMESEVKTLQFYLKGNIIDAEGSYVIGVESKTSVDNLKSIMKKIGGKPSA